MRRLLVSALLTLAAAATAAPQADPRVDDAASLAQRLLAEPAVRAALEAARRDEPRTLDEQAAICEVPAPPFGEQARAAFLKRRFEALGLDNVRIDAVGNLLGERRGSRPAPHLVFSAHLDTVFPEGTDVTVRREGTILKGPGIGDDCRGLAVVLAVARALQAGGVKTAGPITFVATVGEEGLGDLRGVRHLLEHELAGRVERFVSVDGTGGSMTRVGVGSRRYRIAFKGPGGHSYGAFGLANPAQALGRAIARIADFQVPERPKTTFNVGRLGGGTSVNSIPYEAWMEVDLRSADQRSLDAVDAQLQQAIDAALAQENERWKGAGRLTVEKRLVGTRPPGETPAESRMVQTAAAVTSALGLAVSFTEGSTDANAPMALGIPALTIDGGGRGRGAHSLGESFDSTDSWQGTQRALLLAVALAEP